MERVYVETTIPSLLVANPSRDLITAARQLITAEWWNTAKKRFELVISEVVLREVRRGDPQMARKRLDALEDLRILPLTADAQRLAHFYEAHLGLAQNARVDILHLATAVTYEVEYLVTWNLAHLANAAVIRRLQKLNTEIGAMTPLIVTPEELGPASEGSNDVH